MGNKHKQESLLFRQRRPIIVDRFAVIKGLLHLFMMGLMVALPVLFYVWTRLEVVHLNYKLIDLTKIERKVFMEHERLKVELAMLMSPSRLSRIAKQRLNLKNPKQNQIIYMK